MGHLLKFLVFLSYIFGVCMVDNICQALLADQMASFGTAARSARFVKLSKKNHHHKFKKLSNIHKNAKKIVILSISFFVIKSKYRSVYQSGTCVSVARFCAARLSLARLSTAQFSTA